MTATDMNVVIAGVERSLRLCPKKEHRSKHLGNAIHLY